MDRFDNQYVTAKENMTNERYAWRDAILAKYKQKKWYDVLLLMAMNYGEHGNIEDMIKHHCENADPVENWQAFI